MLRGPRFSLPGYIMVRKVITLRDFIPKSTPVRLLSKMELSDGRQESISCVYINLLRSKWLAKPWLGALHFPHANWAFVG
jgi:hypothetical protein